MQKEQQFPYQFPTTFLGLVKVSFQIYQKNWFNFLLLCFVIHLPFLGLIGFLNIHAIRFVEFVTNRLFELAIFLSLPIWFSERRILPFGTLQILFQRYFIQFTLICLVQMLIFFPLRILSENHAPMLLVVSFLSFLFPLFASFFLILDENQTSANIKNYFQNSFRFVQTNFRSIFLKMILIFFLIAIPNAIFTYFVTPEMQELSTVKTNQEFNLVMQKFSKKIKTDSSFIRKIHLIQLLFKPIEALFLNLLFISLLLKISTPKIMQYLFNPLLMKTEENNNSHQEEDQSNSEDNHS